jgi:hypothetical protein
MKKVLLFTTICFATLVVSAQDLITKVPKDASVVVSLKGKNITDLYSISEFENSKMGKMMMEKLSMKTDGVVTNFETLGINLSENFYYFMQIEDGVDTHSFLIPLKDKRGFFSLLSESEKERVKYEDDLAYLVDKYDNTITMWNNNTMLITSTDKEDSYDDYYGYNDYYDDYDVEESVVEDVESYYPIISFYETEYNFGSIKEGDIVEHNFHFTNTGSSPLIISDAKASCGCTVPSFSTEEIASGGTGSISVKFDSSNKTGSQNKTVTITTNTENGIERLYIKGYVSEDGSSSEVVEIVEDVYDDEIEETVIESKEYNQNNYSNNDYYKKREERELKRETERQESLVAIIDKAKKTINGNYANGSILKNASYVKSIGTGKDEATLWVNDFMGIYQNMFSSILGGGYYSSNPYDIFNLGAVYEGMTITSKLNFEDDKASLKAIYTMNEEMAAYNRQMYNGKMNKNFFKYFNEDEIEGYLSFNASTEGIFKAYPKLIEAMFEGVEKEHLEDLVPIGTRLFSLILDEEAIARIIRGDMLLVMSGVETKEVEYTTYEYDENYVSTEVVKTKEETVPNFLFMVTSEEKEIFERLMRIGIKEGGVVFENGIYNVDIPDAPFKLSMVFKDDVLVIGNSSKEIMAISSGSIKGKVSGQHKKTISKNYASMYINGKKSVKDIPNDVLPREIESELSYFAENVEDAYLTVGKMKGNTMEAEMVINKPEDKGHKNSLAYFFNMINTLVD